MLSTEAFEEQYPPEELAEELPDSPIGSLRDLQHLYGTLYTLSTAGGGEYAAYLTPDAAADLKDTDDSLVVVRVDLSGEEPELADDDRGPVWVTRYTDDRVSKVAHCYYQNRGAGIDHSITHKSGKNKSREKLGEYAVHRFTRWPSEDAVKSLAEDHEDGWIIHALAEIGADDDKTNRIKERVQKQLGDDQTAQITVKVRTEKNGEYRWPVDVPVLMDGMRAQRLSKLVTKNKADDSSGEATDIITGERMRTVGTAQDPQNYYLGKQRGTFPGLDINEAWRTHPISEDAAVTLMNAETFVEACTYRTFGAKVYYLPYFFGTLTPDDIYKLYDILYGAVTDDRGMTPVERAYRKFGAPKGTETEGHLRFYVSAVMPHQTSRYDVFGDTMNGRLLYTKQLAIEHGRILSTTTFDSEGDWTSPMPTAESWQLLDRDAEGRLGSISTGWYFAQTFAERDANDADSDAAADDPRIEALVDVLSGDSLTVETLLGEYVARILDEEGDDEHGFPSLLVASQFAQLCALAGENLELLQADDDRTAPITQQPMYDTNTTQTAEQLLADGGNRAAAKLESFVQDTPALAHDPDAPVNDQRRGAFLLGALVGAVGNYQDYDLERSTTLIDQFPVKSISRNRIKKVTQETVAKTLTYTREKKKQGPSFPGTMFDHIVEELRETILDPDPDEWEIGTDDLRFYYALGITYGMNDRYKRGSDTDEESTDEPTATTEEH